MSKEKEIFNYLYELGCCKPCCLRYLFVRTPEVYGKIDSYIKEKKYLDETDSNEEQALKKIKTNACIVCLGLLQDGCINDIVDKVFESDKIRSYDSKVFTCSVSFPASIQIREHSILINLESKFPDFYTYETMETQINKTWKWIMKDKLASRLNKTFEASETCVFSINITLGYELDTEELSVLLKMNPEYFSKRLEQKRKFKGELFSRKGVQNVLTQIKKGIFTEYCPVPPEISTKQLFVEEINCYHNSIYIAGRYCKFSRELCQTPWIINGVKTMETSVQELIFEPFLKKLKISEDGLKFSSSGREDVDVRCLGNGRPFYLEYLDPKKTQFTYEEFRELENQININKDIHVKDLQLVPREDLSYIKEGEETKTKQYEAICICKTIAPSLEQLKKLEDSLPIVLEQKTPIRVLHRRPLATRKRTVLHIKAEKIAEAEENVFKLSLTTQAGTYVKEFVHGDFGRTVPNLGTLLGTDVDIVELDVLSIDLDWPRPVVKPELVA